MYDWTTLAVNLAKGIIDDYETKEKCKCKLCSLRIIGDDGHHPRPRPRYKSRRHILPACIILTLY